MTTQRLHSQLAPIDLLTRDELQNALDHSIDAVIRDRYRGLEIQRFPIVAITALAATLNLASTNDQTPCGPEQGDVWMPRRVNVTSMNLADTAKYILFRGSTPSDPNAYTGRYLLEGFTAGGAGQSVGIGFYPSNKAIYLQPGEQIYAQVLGATVGVQYMLHGDAVRVPAEMKGKVL